MVTYPKTDFQEDLDSLPLFPSPTRVPKPMICGDYIFIKETSFLNIIFRLNYLVQMNSSLNECHSKCYFYRYAYFDFKNMLSSQKLDFKIRTFTYNLIFTDSLWISQNTLVVWVWVSQPEDMNRRISTSPCCLRHRVN